MNTSTSSVDFELGQLGGMVRVDAGGNVTVLSEGIQTVHQFGDVRAARAWVHSLLAGLPAGAQVRVEDELTGTHTLEVVLLAPSEPEPDPAPGVAALPAAAATFAPRPRKKTLVMGAAAAVVLLSGAVVAATVSTQSPSTDAVPAPSTTPPASTSTPSAPASVFPAGFVAQAAAGNLIAGTGPDGAVQLFTAPDATPVAGPALKAASRLQAASGDGVTVISTGTDAGIIATAGKTSSYARTGQLQARGPVPALVGGTAKAPLSYVIRDGKAVQVKPPVKGASFVGALPGGGSAWSAPGSKLVLSTPGKPARSLTLAAPAKGATVASWVTVSQTRVAVVWKSKAGQVLRIHELSKGTAITTLALGKSASVEAMGNSQFLIREGAAPLRWMSLSEAKKGAQPHRTSCAPGSAVIAGTIWCPSKGESWTSGALNVPAKPVAAGTGFVLTGGSRPDIVPTSSNKTSK